MLLFTITTNNTMKYTIYILLSYLLTGYVQASEVSAINMVGIGSILKMFAVLIIIIGIILGLSKIASKRVMKLGGDEMRIVSSVPVGQKERLVLVEVQGEQILVGVATGYVRHISNIHAGKKFSLEDSDDD